MPDDPITVLPLDHPVQLVDTDGRAVGPRITELRFMRRIKAGDMVATDGLGDHAVNVRLIARLTNTLERAVLELDGNDYAAATQVLMGFTPRGSAPAGTEQPDGGKPST